MSEKFSMHIPKEIQTALSRRHSGREDITNDEIMDGRIQMEWLWQEYQKTKTKLDYCEGDWWDKMEVEKHFMQSRWYYAHSKRKKLMKKLKDLHRSMFNLLVTTDGNYEPFGSDAMWAEDVYHDFMNKYPLLIKPKV